MGLDEMKLMAREAASYKKQFSQQRCTDTPDGIHEINHGMVSNFEANLVDKKRKAT
jgi:hypothetical protein